MNTTQQHDLWETLGYSKHDGMYVVPCVKLVPETPWSIRWTQGISTGYTLRITSSNKDGSIELPVIVPRTSPEWRPATYFTAEAVAATEARLIAAAAVLFA